MKITRGEFLRLTSLATLATLINPRELYANPGEIVDLFFDRFFDKANIFTEKGYAALFDTPVTLTIGANQNLDETQLGKLKISDNPTSATFIDLFTQEYPGDMILTSRWDYIAPTSSTEFYGIQIGNNTEPRGSRDFARISVKYSSSPEIVFEDEIGTLGNLSVTASSSLEFRLTKSPTNVVTAEVNQDNNGYQQVGSSTTVPTNTSGMISAKMLNSTFITTYFKLEGTNIPDIYELNTINNTGKLALALSIPLLYKKIKEKEI